MNKTLAFTVALLGALSAAVSLLDFGWSENVVIQNTLIILASLSFEILLLLFLFFIYIANKKYKFLKLKLALDKKMKLFVTVIIILPLLIYGYWTVDKIDNSLGPESVLKMADSGRFLQAAKRARYLSELEEHKEYKLELIKFEQSMLSRDILAKEYEKSFVDNIKNLSEEDANQRRVIGKTLVDPTNTLYESDK
jgi:hypothetical protein